MMAQKTTRTAGKLAIVAAAMFGFGYALVPLYNVFCDITGLNGRTGTIAQEEVNKLVADTNRLVTVEFDTNVNGELPWTFQAQLRQLKIHPGEIADAIFVVENNSDHPTAGQAIPSVAPAQASLYFNKTECFCFTRQNLAPHERREMLVRFVVDSGLPDKISTLTLSYTFFMAPDSNKTADNSESITNTSTEIEKI